MTPASFLMSLADLRCRDTFNPYADACVEHDAADAPLVRLNNLRLVLNAAMSGGVDSIWVARDLGYRGGRRTGLALTDEAHLSAHASLYGELALAKATCGPVMAERTAKVVWSVLRRLERPIFLWNVFPLHPHATNDPLSNRCHTRAERDAAAHLLRWLVSALQPRTVVAIGRNSAEALADIELDARCVRHPSYGGQKEFIEGVAAIYGGIDLREDEAQLDLL